jgi:hypothetical protein
MTRDETIALFLQGRDAWNAWAEARLAEKKALEEAGAWEIGDYDERTSEETIAWMDAAGANFSSIRFATQASAQPDTGQTLSKGDSSPSLQDIEIKTIYLEHPNFAFHFNGFIFPHSVNFSRCHFQVDASFELAQFYGYTQFQGTKFDRPVKFVSAKFFWFATFEDVQIFGEAGFADAQFHGEVRFGRAQFHADADFDRVQFHADADFDRVQFHTPASFASVQFHVPASFTGAQFHARTDFASAQFHADADFDRVKFLADASFASAQFRADADFDRVQFHDAARFPGAHFHANASFASAQFHADADFDRVQFHDAARFPSASFAAATSFRDAAFGTADKPADANFTGIKVERAFDMTGAAFSRVPRFNQADFAQAPDLDDVTYPISDFWRRGVRDDIPRYRHLRRIALGGHNHEAEAMAFKGEVRARRFTLDRWWQPAFWFGVLYDGFSNFGRSLMRPFAVWLGLTLSAALGLFALSPTAPGLVGMPAALISPPACYAPAPGAPGQSISGLSPELRAGTNPRAEAMHLAFHNASVILGAGESTHRSHGCLYGVELHNGADPRAVVPSAVATLSAAHKLFSAIMIFLFLLALRNVLKLK